MYYYLSEAVKERCTSFLVSCSDMYKTNHLPLRCTLLCLFASIKVKKILGKVEPRGMHARSNVTNMSLLTFFVWY